jgi:hypothetical protein
MVYKMRKYVLIDETSSSTATNVCFSVEYCSHYSMRKFRVRSSKANLMAAVVNQMHVLV